jgi:hypothetical protein
MKTTCTLRLSQFYPLNIAPSISFFFKILNSPFSICRLSKSMHTLSASFVAFVDDAGFFPGTASQDLSRMRKIVCFLTAKVQIESTEKDKLVGYFLWQSQVCRRCKPKKGL